MKFIYLLIIAFSLSLKLPNENNIGTIKQDDKIIINSDSSIEIKSNLSRKEENNVIIKEKLLDNNKVDNSAVKLEKANTQEEKLKIIKDKERNIKLLKIDLFGDENFDMEFYEKNRDIYGKKYVERLQSIVKLLELEDELKFISGEDSLNNKMLRRNNENKSNEYLNPKDGLDKTPPKSDEKYTKLFSHDTVMEKNSIIKEKK